MLSYLFALEARAAKYVHVVRVAITNIEYSNSSTQNGGAAVRRCHCTLARSRKRVGVGPDAHPNPRVPQEAANPRAVVPT